MKRRATVTGIVVTAVLLCYGFGIAALSDIIDPTTSAPVIMVEKIPLQNTDASYILGILRGDTGVCGRVVQAADVGPIPTVPSTATIAAQK